MSSTRRTEGSLAAVPPLPVHLSAEQLDLYAGRKLAPPDLLAADDHLAACALCRQALAGRWDEASAAGSWQELAAAAEPEPDSSREARRGAAGLPRWTWPLAAMLLLAAGLALFLRESAVSRERGERQARLRTARQESARLGPEVERLRAENQGLQREVERLASSAVTPDPSSPAAVRLSDQGRPVELARDGTLRGLEDLPAPWRTAVALALTQGALVVPSKLSEIRPPGSTLRGGEPAGAAELAVLAPVGTAVRGDRPRFHWTALAGASSYRVVVFDGRYRQVLDSGELAGTDWNPPRPLPRGEMLSWQVVARRGDAELAAPAPPAPEARFLILSRAEQTALEQAEAHVAGSHLARAALLAQAGLLDEARTAVRALQRENPGSPVVRRLLGKLDSGR